MNRYQAIVEIVRILSRKSPLLALTALTIFTIPPTVAFLVLGNFSEELRIVAAMLVSS